MAISLKFKKLTINTKNGADKYFIPVKSEQKAIMYRVNYTLDGAALEHMDIQIKSGTSYTNKIILQENYLVKYISVKMNNVDITSTAVSDNTIFIESVSGNIQINIFAYAGENLTLYSNYRPNAKFSNSIEIDFAKGSEFIARIDTSTITNMTDIEYATILSFGFTANSITTWSNTTHPPTAHFSYNQNNNAIRLNIIGGMSGTSNNTYIDIPLTNNIINVKLTKQGLLINNTLITKETEMDFYNISNCNSKEMFFDMISYMNGVLYYGASEGSTVSQATYNITAKRVISTVDNTAITYSANNIVFKGANYIDTGIKLFNPARSFMIKLDFTNSEYFKFGPNTHTVLHCIHEVSPWYGLVVQDVSSNSMHYEIHPPQISTVKLTSNNGVNAGASLRARVCLSYNNDTGEYFVVYKDSDGKSGQQSITKLMTNTIEETLLLGCYRDTNDVKGRFWYGTINSIDVLDTAGTIDEAVGYVNEIF